MNSFVFCLLIVVAFGSCLKLPSSFKKCDRKRTDFNQCLSEAIHGALRILEKPLPSHDLPSLFDVEFPDLVATFGNRTYGLLQKYDQFRLIGLSQPENIDAKLDFRPLTSTLTIAATYPQLTIEIECEAKGTIVVLPVNVITPVANIFDHPTFTFTFELEEYEKGTTYFRVIDSKLDMQVEGIKFGFEHLFSDKVLNEKFNSAMSAKWRSVFAIFKSFEAIFAPRFGSIFNTLLKKVPVAELFD
ncbi:hypothetical protein Zmor_018826 [Zophobas morio]|uniref:Uncharacterized protein n=1 Tax=Zophobas morio TaxID=2755281 RepID=A0AA38MED5_9CUCU|nr:hypothetical protein Zmor_018826 [Zophobas morio]